MQPITNSDSGASGSFLVRLWREPREQNGEMGPYRLYLRNLQTGEEYYLGDPALLPDEMLKQLGIEDSQEFAAPTASAG